MNRILCEILESVQRPGSFATSGVVSPFFPDLQVDNVGRIGLPLCHAQAMELKSQCEQAPFGRREETIVDTSVRNALQLDASKLKIGSNMKKVVASLIPSLATELGCDRIKVTARPYKLVLYEKGGFFLPHRDTEKVNGMFATLVIQLPAEHSGGQLVVQHNREEKVFDFAKDSASKIFYAAFFADCRHELRPVTSGLRLCLIYNLVHSNSTSAPTPADHSQAVSRIVQAVRNWSVDQNAPAKLIYVLHHEYTEAGLSFSGLKNRDRAVADAVRQVAQEAELKVYLAIVTKNESGSAEGGRSYYKRRRWGYDYESEDPDDWSMCEVCDSDVTLGNWVGLNDEHKEFGEMNVDVEDEVLQEDDPFENLEPDHVEVEECSGNEGATMERWYHLAALVFWPCAKAINIEFEALLRSGIGSAVKKLQANITECAAGSTAAELQECHKMIRLLVKHLEKQSNELSYFYGGVYCVSTMLAIVQNCDDLQLYIEYIAVVTKKGFSAEIAESLLLGCEHFGWVSLHNSLCAMLQHNVNKQLKECVSFVAKFCQAEGAPSVFSDQQQLHTCRELATIVHSAVIANPAQVVPVIALFKVLYVVNQPQLLKEAVAHFKTNYMHQVESSLTPAVMNLSSWLGAKAKDCGQFVELLELCIASYAAKTRTSLSEPTTWVMKVPFPPCCADCKLLAAFLINPTQQVSRFKMAYARRRHLEQRLHGLDAMYVTERIGSPQTLVVTKTRTVVQRQKEQRQKDLQTLAQLRALLGATGITDHPRVAATEVVDLTKS